MILRSSCFVATCNFHVYYSCKKLVICTIQVARISGAVGPHITASAAEAAVTALCYENQCSTDIFDEDDDGLGSIADISETER